MKNNNSTKIRSYLQDHGRMSARDIMTDLNVDELDIEAAELTGYIAQTGSPCNASSQPWFRASARVRQ